MRCPVGEEGGVEFLDDELRSRGVGCGGEKGIFERVKDGGLQVCGC